MKKRSAALILTAALIIGAALSSCGEKERKPELSRVTNVYGSTAISLPDNLRPSKLIASAGGVMALAVETLGEDPYEAREVILELDIESGGYELLPMEGLDELGVIMAFGIAPDGAAVLLTSVFDPE